MPNITIDTNDADYRRVLANLREVQTLLRPRLRVLAKLPPEKQRQWRQRDPLLKAVLRLVREVNKADVELGEAD